jgi:hypothetical protein
MVWLRLLLIFQWMSASAINPSKLLVATIIDPNVERILKDSKLLFQSIRLFGGSLNQATLLACILVDHDFPFHNDTLIALYLEMGVVIDFVPRVSNPFPGTMNKFLSMQEYDSSKFDYFLWLDADIVVFHDPIPLLSQRYRSGHVQCVPEMYNYMSRFPKVNESELFWNPSLSKFVLADDGLIAPHGVCNTGVLFFDSQSLKIFLSTLHSPTLTQVMNVYPTDRFLDSLCFVAVVNIANLQVEPLDYALNYMAFLEIYIERLKLTSYDPIFVHFIANSTLECSMNEACSCLYINDEMVSKESKIVQQIKDFLLPLGACRILAGVDPSPPAWAGSNESSQPSPIIVESNKLDHCFLSLHFPSPEMMIFYDFSEISLYLTLDSAKCRFLISITDSGTQQTLLSDTYQFPEDSLPNSTLLVEFSIPHNLISANGINRVELRLSDLSLTLILVCRSKLTNGFQTYSLNYLMNQLPLALHSQVHLPEYLNTRQLTQKGLVVCCATQSGVQVVENLIERWSQYRLHGGTGTGGLERNPLLIILIKSRPSEMSQFDSLEQLALHFSVLCQRSASASFSQASCVIVQELGLSEVFGQISTARSPFLDRNKFLSFVYLDMTGSSFQREMAALNRWYNALLPGGLLIGSQYASPLLLKEYSGKFPNHLRYNELIVRSAVIDNFAFLQRNTPLFTSHEMFFSVRGNGNDLFALLPAWYFVKQNRGD